MSNIKITDVLIEDLCDAQMKTAAAFLQEGWTNSSDGQDYLYAAVNFAATMIGIRQTMDYDAMNKLLNEPGAIVNFYAVEGVAMEFNKLDCKGMSYDD